MKRLKQTYESPLMWRTLVELEDGFCAASADVQNPNKDYGKINAQEVNQDFSNAADFSNDSWDK